MDGAQKEKFCKNVSDSVIDESKATIEYAALALDSLNLDNPQKEAVSIVLEKLRDDENSHKMALEKIRMVVCPIERK